MRVDEINTLIASITARLRRLSVEELRVLDDIALALESEGLRDDAHARRMLAMAEIGVTP